MGNQTQGKQTAVVMGKTPTDENIILKTDRSGNLKTVLAYVEDSPDKDAFGRIRSSTPYNIFDVAFPYDKQPLIFDESLTGGATSVHDANRACIEMTTGTASGDKVIRQSKMYCKYQPGRSQLVLLTGVMGAAKANVRKRLGYFDAANGIFFEQTSAGIRWVRRTFTSGSAVDNHVDQEDWNLDKLDGTGISGLTLDITKAQIWLIDLQWLGVGRVRVGFEIGGVFYPCHQFMHANTLSDVYMSTATLPIRYEIENTDVAVSSTTMKQICSAVIAEGGFAPRYTSRAAAVTIGVAISTTIIPLMSIRLSSTYIRRQIYLASISVLSQAADDVLFEVIQNGTLTGASFTSAGANSIAEVDFSASAISGGIVQYSDWISDALRSGQVLPEDERIGIFANIAGTSDILTLAARIRTGSGTAFGTMRWKELL